MCHVSTSLKHIYTNYKGVLFAGFSPPQKDTNSKFSEIYYLTKISKTSGIYSSLIPNSKIRKQATGKVKYLHLACNCNLR